MTTWVDECIAHAPPELCFQVAREIERWPEFLPHIRRVRYLTRSGPGNGKVEFTAWQIFGGPLRLPTRWSAEIETDETTLTITHRHLDGITRSLLTNWEIIPADVDTKLRISLSWTSTGWPLVGAPARKLVVGPYLVGSVTRRTLTGIAVEAQRLTHAGR